AGFIVLHQTFMPSVLVETGFLTNKKEGAYLNSKNGQTEVGTAIADAILEYKKVLWVKAPEEVKKPIAPQPEAATRELPLTTEKTTSQTAVGNTDKTTPAVGTTTPPPVGENEKKVAERVDLSGAKKDMDTPSKPLKTEENIIFKVQLLASSKDMFTDPANFNGLNKISKEPINDLYRYMYGNTGSYEEAQLLKTNAEQKGYSSAYIVAYKDGKRNPLSQALATEDQEP